MMTGDQLMELRRKLTTALELLKDPRPDDLLWRSQLRGACDDAQRQLAGGTFPDLFAYLGENELDAGTIGLKQARVTAGCIPLAAVDRGKLDRYEIVEQLQLQVDNYGKPIHFVRYTPSAVLTAIKPTSRAASSPARRQLATSRR